MREPVPGGTGSATNCGAHNPSPDGRSGTFSYARTAKVPCATQVFDLPQDWTCECTVLDAAALTYIYAYIYTYIYIHRVCIY